MAMKRYILLKPLTLLFLFITLSLSQIVFGQSQTVMIEVLKTENVKQELKIPGRLTSYEKVKLYSRATGYIGKIFVDIGDAVKKGDLLAELDLPELDAEYRSAQATVTEKEALKKMAQANNKLKQSIAARLKELKKLQAGAVTDTDIDIAQSEAEVATAQLAVADARLLVANESVKRINALLSYGKIRAPFDGKIFSRWVDTGSLITADDLSNALLSIGRTDTFRLVTDIPEKCIAHIAKGGKIQFSFSAMPKKLYDGKINRLSGELNELTMSMRIEVDVPAEPGLYSGMYANVTLPFHNFSNVFTAPTKALRFNKGVQGIYIVENGKAAWVPIRRLHDDGKKVVIESVENGRLTSGSKLIVAAHSLLEDGEAVKTRERISR